MIMRDLDTIFQMYGLGAISIQQLFRPCHKQPREIIDVDYVEITDEGEIHHTRNPKLIDNGTERLLDRGIEGRVKTPEQIKNEETGKETQGQSRI